MCGLIKKEHNGLKLIISIFVIVIVLLFVSYFIWSWNQLNDKSISLSDLAEYDYLSADNNYILRFVNDRYVVFTTIDNRYIFDYGAIVYKDGIIELKSDNNELFLFSVLSDNRIYNNTFNVVLYGL